MDTSGLPYAKPRPRKVTKARLTRAQKTAHRAVYAAVTARDGGCRVCSRTWGLHRHHVVFRSQGGKTTTANVLLLCDKCHSDVHKRQLTLSGDADTGLLIT